jgi:hypothetical protein
MENGLEDKPSRVHAEVECARNHFLERKDEEVMISKFMLSPKL